MTWFFVGIGGALGAITRYKIGITLNKQKITLPLATITVNLIGSLIFGLLFASFLQSTNFELYLFFTGGFLGAFTTFSTFTYEGIGLLQKKYYLNYVIYIIIHLVLGIGMAGTGYYLGTMLF